MNSNFGGNGLTVDRERWHSISCFCVCLYRSPDPVCELHLWSQSRFFRGAQWTSAQQLSDWSVQWNSTATWPPEYNTWDCYSLLHWPLTKSTRLQVNIQRWDISYFFFLQNMNWLAYMFKCLSYFLFVFILVAFLWKTWLCSSKALLCYDHWKWKQEFSKLVSFI